MPIPGWFVGSSGLILLIFLDASFREWDAAFFTSPGGEALCFHFKPDCTRSSSHSGSLSSPISMGIAIQMGVKRSWLTSRTWATTPSGSEVPEKLLQRCQPPNLSLSQHALSIHCAVGPKVAVGIPVAYTFRFSTGSPTHEGFAVLSSPPICDFSWNWWSVKRERERSAGVRSDGLFKTCASI